MYLYTHTFVPAKNRRAPKPRSLALDSFLASSAWSDIYSFHKCFRTITNSNARGFVWLLMNKRVTFEFNFQRFCVRVVFLTEAAAARDLDSSHVKQSSSVEWKIIHSMTHRLMKRPLTHSSPSNRISRIEWGGPPGRYTRKTNRQISGSTGRIVGCHYKPTALSFGQR